MKLPEEIPGYVLDGGKFYEGGAANELLASDPAKYLERFRQAVKRDGELIFKQR